MQGCMALTGAGLVLRMFDDGNLGGGPIGVRTVLPSAVLARGSYDGKK